MKSSSSNDNEPITVDEMSDEHLVKRLEENIMAAPNPGRISAGPLSLTQNEQLDDE